MILIIDFGSQFNQLIARRVRECKVYCQIVPPNIKISEIKKLKPEGIILSGGPASIYEKKSPKVNKGVFNLGLPILGICYGMQFMVDALGGKVQKSQKREYGFAELKVKSSRHLFKSVGKTAQCWMSHGDSITELPAGFKVTGTTDNTPIAAAVNLKKKFYGLQFHPEVEHTPKGKAMLQSFLFDVCNCSNHGQ